MNRGLGNARGRGFETLAERVLGYLDKELLEKLLYSLFLFSRSPVGFRD